MFQTYDPVSDRSFASKHLPLLREVMKAQSLDGFLVPHDDEYQNEYIPAYAERLMWVSGFSGSAGSAIIMQERAVIFVDGRYTLQVRDQTDDHFFEFESLSENPPHKWLAQNTKSGQTIGYDPMLHSVHGLSALKQAAQKSGCTLVPVARNPIDEAWDDQPAHPDAKIVPHPLSHAGKSAEEKRARIAEDLTQRGIDAALITAPPSIAWAFNIRGGDVDRSPLPLSRAILYKDGKADIFFDERKNSNSLTQHLGSDVSVHNETRVNAVLQSLAQKKQKILLDAGSTPIGYADLLKSEGAVIVHGDDPCALPRACKNETEINGTRQAHIRDGVAVTQFLHWFAHEAQDGETDEITAAKKLEEFRAQSDELKDLSFDSISGSGPNGAIVHYRVSTLTNRKLEKQSLFLIDSGGQYKDGTTDITRTLPVGTPSDEMKDRFTRVLKGHIALATARFPTGTSGHQLDAFARRPLWEAGLDYDHGTGHGVGSFLGVHEGPQRIASWPNPVALQPGMILSNEPGYYKSGEYGIRIENLIVVKPLSSIKEGERPMMGFETITLAPINLDMIDPSILTQIEIDWLNDYHHRVRETLSPLLPAPIADWLKDVTKPL